MWKSHCSFHNNTPTTTKNWAVKTIKTKLKRVYALQCKLVPELVSFYNLHILHFLVWFCCCIMICCSLFFTITCYTDDRHNWHAVVTVAVVVVFDLFIIMGWYEIDCIQLKIVGEFDFTEHSTENGRDGERMVVRNMRKKRGTTNAFFDILNWRMLIEWYVTIGLFMFYTDFKPSDSVFVKYSTAAYYKKGLRTTNSWYWICMMFTTENHNF